MRAMFGLISLVVVLAIVGLIASRQLKALNQGVASAGAQTGTTITPTGNVAEQAKQIQDKVRDDVNKALEQGAKRNEDADK